MKTLAIITTTLFGLLFAGCTWDDSSEPVQSQPANQTATQPANQPATQPAAAPQTTPQYQMTPAERRVYELQELDRKYQMGGMTPGEYNMQRERIHEMY